NRANIKNTIKKEEVPPKLSPILAESMRFGLIIEFLLIAIPLLQYIFNFDWHNDCVFNYYPLNQYYPLFLFTIILNGLISTWKGYKVDGKLFFAGHHFFTMIVIFWSMYPMGPTPTRFFIYIINYLIMRLVKRIKDDGYLTKDQWVTFYVSYAYFQTAMGIIIMCLYPKSPSGVDMIGSLAHLDSLITCRKENFGGKLLKDSSFLIPINWLVDQKYKIIQNVLSVLDVASLWSLIILSSKLELSFNLFKYLIPFILLEFAIKPLFKNFKRPYTYKFSNHSSFPSTHACICGIIVSCIASLTPTQRLISILSMGFYRIYSRAHTIEDVCAGIAM
ncbi:hypothetical protein DICPUDRAFT_18544, partial [Dictyostelium purpureum]